MYPSLKTCTVDMFSQWRILHGMHKNYSFVFCGTTIEKLTHAVFISVNFSKIFGRFQYQNLCLTGSSAQQLPQWLNWLCLSDCSRGTSTEVLRQFPDQNWTEWYCIPCWSCVRCTPSTRHRSQRGTEPGWGQGAPVGQSLGPVTQPHGLSLWRNCGKRGELFICSPDQ